MSTIFKRHTSIFTFSVVAIVLLFLCFFVVLTVQKASANVLGDLQSESARLEDEIASNEAYIAELQARQDTLQNKIDELDAQINVEETKIKLTQTKIEKLVLEIEKTEAELDRQKGLLKHSLIKLYKEGNITTIEMLASSESYTDFINQQEYLSRIKDQIHESAKKVEDLKLQLESDKKDQDDLLAELKAQRDTLAVKKDAQSQLLRQTEGEEQRYQTIVGELAEQKAAADARVEAFLASLANNYVSLGPVAAGDVIGSVGMTGVSTGPHVHFEVRTPNLASPAVDPLPVINSKNWTWPVPGGTISQSFHGGHNALDIAGVPYGSPVVAAASGNIIHRGCIDEGTVWANYMVIIDHGGGFFTRYAHLVAPDSPAYDGCRANTYPWW